MCFTFPSRGFSCLPVLFSFSEQKPRTSLYAKGVHCSQSQGCELHPFFFLCLQALLICIASDLSWALTSRDLHGVTEILLAIIGWGLFQNFTKNTSGQALGQFCNFHQKNLSPAGWPVTNLSASSTLLSHPTPTYLHMTHLWKPPWSGTSALGCFFPGRCFFNNMRLSFPLPQLPDFTLVLQENATSGHAKHRTACCSLPHAILHTVHLGPCELAYRVRPIPILNISSLKTVTP